ncbi:MAG TPA: hypothetical protein VGB82_18070 [Alphaproteobacteria bacterium]
MGDTVLVQIPVSKEAAEALSDEERRARIGRLVSVMVRPSSAEGDPLAALIAEIKAAARDGKLSDAEIDAEADAYNAERRL